jgi:hypothetical protein
MNVRGTDTTEVEQFFLILDYLKFTPNIFIFYQPEIILSGQKHSLNQRVLPDALELTYVQTHIN